MCDGIRALLADAPDISPITEAQTLSQALARTHEDQPDVIILGLTLNAADMRSAIAKMSDAAPASRIIVLSLHDDPAYRASAIANGASAYLLKDTVYDDLAATIRGATVEPASAPPPAGVSHPSTSADK